VGFREIWLDPDPARIQDSEIVLAVGDAVVGSLLEPFRRGLVIRAAFEADRIEHGEIVHRLGIALLGGRDVKAACLHQVLFYALAFFIEAAETVLRGSKPAVRRTREPMRGLLGVLGYGAAFDEP